MARWGGATRRPRGKVLVRIVSVAVGTAAIVILAFAVSRKNPTKTNANPLDTPPDTMATQHYRFTYPRPFRLRVQRLAAQADALCERGAAALKADCPAKISVDLTRASDTHAGSAALGTIRIDLTAHLDEATLERTLAHETVHTLVAAQTRGRALDAGALRFFDEGLAEFVALKLLPDEATARARVFRTVLARQRLNIGLDVITDYERLRRTADQDLVYDFGLTWLNALVVTCGQGAPAAVVLALSRTDKNGLDGTAFWRDTLRKAGCGWDAVAAQWNLMQDAELGRLKGELDRVPDLVGSVARRDADSVEVVGRLEGTPPPDAAYRLRLRDNDSEPESRYRTFVGEVTSDGAVHFEIQRYEISGERFQFQLGLQWSSLGTTLTHFERWQDG
jgi:hypothetical protein